MGTASFGPSGCLGAGNEGEKFVPLVRNSYLWFMRGFRWAVALLVGTSMLLSIVHDALPHHHGAWGHVHAHPWGWSAPHAPDSMGEGRGAGHHEEGEHWLCHWLAHHAEDVPDEHHHEGLWKWFAAGRNAVWDGDGAGDALPDVSGLPGPMGPVGCVMQGTPPVPHDGVVQGRAFHPARLERGPPAGI